MVFPLAAVLPFIGGLIGQQMASGEAGKTAASEMRSKILTGREFGLHPLASIGASTSGYTGNYIGEGLAEAGRALGDQAARNRRDPLEAKQGELLDAQIAESRSRTILNAAEAHSRGNVIDPYKMRTENALIRVKLENGDVIEMPNPDVYEVSPTELATARAIIEAARVYQSRPTASNPPEFRRSGKRRAEDMGPLGLP